MTGRDVARRAIFITNPHSGRAAEMVERSLFLLRAIPDLTVEIAESGKHGISDTIRAWSDRADLVIIAGGDGTMNAAASGLMETGLPLGILPLGTANDLARTLGIPADIDGAVEVIRVGRIAAIDLGQVNGKPYFNVASVGMPAEVAEKLTRDIKRRFGRLGYLLTALRVLLTARPFRATIAHGDVVARVRTLQITVGNGLFYGGGLEVERGAAIDDQCLNLYSLEMGSAWKLLLMARAFRAGEHGAWQDVRVARASVIEIRTSRPRKVNADGELLTVTPARFEVRPGAVRVCVPPRAPGLQHVADPR